MEESKEEPFPCTELDRKDQSPADISLRLFDLSDVDAFMEWAMDDRVSRFCRWDTFKSRDDCLSFIVNAVIPHPRYRAICVDDRPVGAIRVSPNESQSAAELGYELAFRYWGKGIVTKAVNMVVSVIFKEWPELKRLEAFVGAENAGSIRVLEKAGFEREWLMPEYVFLKGKLRGVLKFRLLRSDLQAS